MQEASWDLEALAGALATFDPAQGTTLVAGWLATGGILDTYAQAAATCANYRRYDLAARIFEAAWRSGTRAYDAAYAVEMHWRDAADGRAVATLAENVSDEIGGITFRQEGDEFHVGATRRILANLAGLARVEEGEPPGELEPGSLHPFAAEAIWRRIWACHNALQFGKAQALAREALRLMPPDDATTLYVAGTFFGFHGAPGWALEHLRTIASASPLAVQVAALRIAIAFEAEDNAEFRAGITALAALDDRQAENDEAGDAARASGLLYEAFDAFNRGQAEACLTLAEAGRARFGDRSWAPLFDLARGMALEQQHRPAAVACYAEALKAEGDVRMPHIAHVAADAAAAEGRWDITYAYLENHATAMRPLYAALTGGESRINTLDARFPERGVALSGWGVGDGIIAYGLLRRHLPEARYAMAMDRRLLGLARRAQPAGEFMAQTLVAQVGAAQYAEERRGVPETVDALRCPALVARRIHETGAVILQEDLTALHAARGGQPPGGRVAPVFAADPARIDAMRAWLASVSDGRPCVGLGWRSGVRTQTRARTFLSEGQVARLMREAPVAWVLMQYDWDRDELERIEQTAGTKFLVCPDLDIKQDLEGLAALACACDMVMCTGVATRDLAAAAGARVLSLHHGRPNTEAWRRDATFNDTIFPSMTHVDPANGGDGVVEQAIAVANELVKVRRRGPLLRWLHRLGFGGRDA